ncbi:glutamate-cysteine ligase catalytic subunit, partial [Dacryopinax primogenitus]
MGLLSLGTPLAWADSIPYHDHVRQHGITQFLHAWDRLKTREGDDLLWGDEIEYMVVAFDDEHKVARLSLRQSEILKKLAHVVEELEEEKSPDTPPIPTFHPEYGRFMLESTPGKPYTGSLKELLTVEANMRYRRKIARRHLKPNEVPLTVTSFPRLGTQGQFTEPYFEPKSEESQSLFLPSEITNPFARFPTLTANIRRRRGHKVAINLPIFEDTHTPKPFIDPTIPWDRALFPGDSEAKDGAALPDHIYMDAMGFGMGCCCLQMTFQACNVDEARRVYDALIPVGPIMLALTAAAPAYRGYLSDVDCRWNVIRDAVDDRTEEERGLKPLEHDRYRIPKSRYDSVDSYLSMDYNNRPEYNDNPLPIDEGIYNRLRDHGLDDLLSKHIAHLFIRDPLVIFSEMIDQDDLNSTDHFENIQSTNWQTLRFKPPPANSPIGWRVEFRSMEVQVTDYENAAFCIFIVLLSRAILSFDLNFYIPISKVDENMKTAQKRDAARKDRFWFRKFVYPQDRAFELRHAVEACQGQGWTGTPTPAATPAATPGPSRGSSPPTSAVHTPLTPLSPISPPRTNGFPPHTHTHQHQHQHQHTQDERSRPVSASQSRCPSPGLPERGPVEEEYELMTLDEIVNGKEGYFPGLFGVVAVYLNSLDVDFHTKRSLYKYLDVVRRRANGSLMTCASWMRRFIRSHPDYKFDSVVSEQINYDLMKAFDEIERGVRKEPDFLPSSYRGDTAFHGHLNTHADQASK